ncbi:glycosyltransferase [Xanthomonas floridensis]|uniref:Glycosyltransferase n=1 Tax=Xanthomonas floridensis TaxID=1843580 RepID=A0ABU5PT79_9XANT|nr:glycosyltransferase [Xanthomonas floridensis]MEA5122803.1 glycosyltransferase [Xanthomonas floridensis]MEA5131156.1 glycosyltransferase [Xanthomonas floridensis]
MRIVLDLQGAQTSSRDRGIGRYSLALAEAMLRQPRNHEFWIVTNADIALPDLGDVADLVPPERRVSFRTVQPTHWQDSANDWRRMASERAREAFLRALKPDVVHVSSLMEGSQDCAVTSIGVSPESVFAATTLYDLIPMHHPEYLAAAWAKRWYQDKLASLKRADLLLAISDYVRSDAMEMLSIPAERIVNISSAAAKTFKPIFIDLEIRERFSSDYGISGPYLMYSGAMDARKNLERLLVAYSMLSAASIARCQLVVSGRLSSLERDRLGLIANRLCIAPDRLVLVGHVSDLELAQLYSGAELFVLPSLHEGFGLPILEAMACGAPVIGSNLTSIPEVLTRRDALFDPEDPSSIAGAIERVLCEPALAQDLRQYGLRRSHEFSWASSASRALDAFESRARAGAMIGGWAPMLDAQDASRRVLIGELADMNSASLAVTDHDLMAAAAAVAANEEVIRDVYRRHEPLALAPSWRVEGPFDSSYSLALVNRELAKALNDLGLPVALHSTDGFKEILPDQQFMNSFPALEKLHAKAARLMPRQADISSRLIYPPHVADMDSRLNFLHAYAWEESEIPSAWIEDFNEFLQGISALSSHVGKVLIDNGVGLPIGVCGAGVDHWDRVPDDGVFPINARSFRFLHVSSCLPRKGVDVLLQSYGEVFTDADDVTLIIKTFANPQQNVRHLLHKLQKSNSRFPHVIVIEEDVESAQLKSLYRQCHVMVAPSRAEGFGLPLAEAMMSGLAVIATGWGGQCDFCTPDTAWLIDYKFAKAQTIFDLPDSVWAEPCPEHLSRLLKEVWGMPAGVRDLRTKRGQSLLIEHFTWSAAARRLLHFAHDVSRLPKDDSTLRLAWVGSFDCKRTASIPVSELIHGLPHDVKIFSELDVNNVESKVELLPCWRAQSADFANVLLAEIDVLNPTWVAIHCQAGLIAQDQLELLLMQLRTQYVSIVLILEDDEDIAQWAESLLAEIRQCARVLVSDVDGLNALRKRGVVDISAILPRHSFAEAQEPARTSPSIRLWNMLQAIHVSSKLTRGSFMQPHLSQLNNLNDFESFQSFPPQPSFAAATCSAGEASQ